MVTIASVLVGSSMFVSAANAHDDSDTALGGIVNSADTFVPLSNGDREHDDAFNGFKVYLSSPRHGDSGSRGECSNPGREENINGRRWNFLAANGYTPSETGAINPALYMHGRGYKVQVSPNTRDNGYLANRTASENWGADLHIVTHTNADAHPGTCNGTASYLYTAWEHDANATDDKDLAVAIGQELNPHVPDSWSNVQRPDLAELERNAPKGDAYVELQFHNKQSSQTWIYNHSDRGTTWHLGAAVDDYLNYP